MRWQRNMGKIKEQNKIPEKELNKTKTSNLLHVKFKTLVVRMFKDLSEDFNEKRRNIKM